MFLDFSAVRRMNPAALRAIEDFAGAADEKSVKVTLRGVNVDIYKVLKLARLSSRFLGCKPTQVRMDSRLRPPHKQKGRERELPAEKSRGVLEVEANAKLHLPHVGLPGGSTAY